MNIVFLDIDGVIQIHRAERYFEKVNYGYNPQVFHNFLRIIEEASIPTKIVLNSITKNSTNRSSWWWIRTSKFKKRFKALLHPQWNEIPWRFIIGNREDGISHWMYHFAEKTDVAIAIDDSPGCYQNAESLGIHFIRCYTEAGLTMHQLSQLELAVNGTFSTIESSRVWDKTYGRG